MPDPRFEDELSAIKATAARLRDELADLQYQIHRLEHLHSAETRPKAEPSQSESPSAVSTPPAYAPLFAERILIDRPIERDVEQVIGQTWLNRVGAVILLLAFVFFVKYSFDQGWLSPTTRVVIGIASGLLLVGLGEFSLFRGMRTFAGGLLGCGIGVLYLSAFGSYNYYHLINSDTAFAFYCCVTALAVLVSVHGRLLAVAILAGLGGFGTPIALSTGENQQVALLTYLMVIDVGFLAAAVYRRWDAVRLLSWLGTVLLFWGWAVDYYEPLAAWRTAGFVLAFYLLFQVEVIWSVCRRAFDEPWLAAVIVHLNNVLFFASIYFLLRNVAPDWMGLFAVTAAAIQWSTAWRMRGDDDEVVVRVGSALWQDGAAMLALAAPMQFDRYMVSVSWSVQAAVTFWFCRRSARPWLRLKGYAIVAAAVIHLCHYDIADNQLTTVVWSAGNFTFAWILACFVLLGLCCYFAGAALVVWRNPPADDRISSAMLFAAGNMLILGIFSHQWERYLATWWWLGLGAAWFAVALRARQAGVVVASIGLAVCAKFLVWDTLGAAIGPWRDIHGMVLNRAVVTGLAVAAFLAVTRRTMASALSRAQDLGISSTQIDATAVLLALLVLIWTGTFEIARVFRFEEFRERFDDPKLAMHLFITVFWSAGAVAVLAGGFLRRRPELRYLAILLFAATLLKVLVYDMSHLEMVYRIVSFFVLGILLLFASMLYQRRTRPKDGDDAPLS